MGIEFILDKTNSGKYQSLKSPESSKTIIRSLNMYGFGDCMVFFNENNYGSHWGLENLSCFKELSSYERLMDVPEEGIKKLAARMHELLYKADSSYDIAPKITGVEPKYKQILKELISLQKNQKEMVETGKIIFPDISDEEMEMICLW